ncbi:MAG: GNAT family N-acetyltransferase [Alphaproteobacteria bacterium]|nr:GNAT family N-acetyltransferase [Alphaproteobacteria bacterium]
MFISALTQKDCAAAAILHQEVFFKNWEEHIFKDFLQNSMIHGLKLKHKGQLCGYILWREVEGEAEILTFVVAPFHQRKGLGNRLILTFFEVMAKKEITDIFLEVAEDNEKGINFYRKYGFAFLSKRPFYYLREGNRYVSALNFSKKLV